MAAGGFRALGGDCIYSCDMDGFGKVPHMAWRERHELEAAGVLPPFGQRGVLIAAPASPWAVVPDVVAGGDD
jgi:hypothetical protein